MKEWNLCVWVGLGLIPLLIALAVQASSEQSRTVGGSGLVAGGRSLRRSHRNPKFPLKPEGPRRKLKRNGECRLGATVKEIGDTWSPDLGEPFGVMSCIHCACEAVQKKRRIVGRIRCRNLKSECPKVECRDAISLPGQCCKTCPDNSKSNSDKSNSDGVIADDDSNENNNKEYAALLTPRSSTLVKSSTGLGEPMTGGLGAGRFMFLHRNLYYSFVYGDGLPRPKFVQFVDPEGNVVEEQEVTTNNYQNDTLKICGVWRKMPRVYRKLLKEEKLFAALVTEKIGADNERFLAGRVAKQRYVSTELYSSLLEPATQEGTGGMAVITVSPSTGSIYVNVVFNGDFAEERDITIKVRISDGSGVGVEESVTIPKIQYESNSIEVRAILEHSQLTSLSRGTLLIVVYSPKNPGFKQIGVIQSRHSCDIFDTVLSSEEAGNGNSALAWVYPLADGSWSYNIQYPREQNTLSVKLETGRKVLEELPIRGHGNMTRDVVGGMSSRYFQLLYEGNIYLNVVTDSSNFRGRLTYRGFGDAQLSDAPLLLESSSKRVTSDLRTQGLLWLGVDTDCSLNYQVTLSQRPKSALMRLELTEMPALQMKGLPVRSYTLDNFEANDHEGIFSDVAKISFAHINAGDAVFKVIRVNDSSTLASTTLKNVRIPSSCLPTTAASDNNILHPDYTLEPEDDASMPIINKCYHDGQLREEYSQWTPNNDTCTICNCFKGVAKCETVVCPMVDCINPVFLTGECCRTCLNERVKNRPISSARGCSVEGDRFHPAGSTWHPYMPPNGFMVCTTCSCNADTLTVECTREQCPSINCGADEAIYPRPLACCKVCPPKKAIDPDTINDDVAQYDLQKRGPSPTDILAAGGCKFREALHKNGDEWNHRMEPFGNIPCVVCSCRNGETKCGRKKCPNLQCEVKVKEEGECCSRCSTDSQARPKGPSFLSRQRRPPSKQKSKVL